MSDDLTNDSGTPLPHRDERRQSHVDDPDRDAFLARPWSMPALSGKRVLVIGIGGGSDAISAYALAQHLKGVARAVTLYGNTKSGRKLLAVEAELRASGGVELGRHLWSLPGEPVPLAGAHNATHGGDAAHGGVAIDNSLPRDDAGSPLVCVLPHKDHERSQALTDSIRELGVDHIFAVDTGGDVFLPSEGRDVRMLRLLAGVGCPTTLTVFGPGSDGSATSLDMLFSGIRTRRERGLAGHYEGCMQLEPLLPQIAPFTSGLAADRTPKIMLDAAGRPADEAIRVPRERYPTIPAGWLSHILFFTVR